MRLEHELIVKAKHWRAFPAIFGLQAAPVLEFQPGNWQS